MYVVQGICDICGIRYSNLGIGDIDLQVNYGNLIKTFTFKNEYYVPDMVKNLVIHQSTNRFPRGT